jgi:predicted lipoprotein with Yx(FWY)xxD motif
MMRAITTFGLAAAMAAALSATALAATESDAAAPGVVTTQAIPGGAVFADIAGRTLYTSDADGQGKSACTGDCTRNWSPLAAAWLASATGDWTLVTRDDGSKQWAFKGKPLYVFTGDHKAGDVNGDGAAGGWHAVVTARQFLPPDVAIWHSDFGPAFRTADGHTLYVLAELKFNPLGTKRHTGANLGLTECTGKCLQDWPPLEAPADAKAADDWSVVTRADGIRQWAYKGWPVYRNAQDQNAGDTFGEGVTTVRNGISGLSWQVATLL